MNQFSDDWLDFLASLSTAEARFLLVGAHAMAVHGVPRGTQDLDVWIDRSQENVERVWNALLAFGAPLESLSVNRADLQKADVVLQLGVAPNRIDILTSLSGLDHFADAWQGRVEQRLGSLMIPVLGRSELLTNKRASARPKDLADVSILEKSP
jgi:hypothetical protein